MTEQVLKLDLTTGISQSVPSVTGAFAPGFAASAVQALAAIKESARDQLEDLKVIYSEPSPQLGQAVTLLSEAAFACVEAIDAEENSKRFRADDCMLRVQAISSQLFDFRSLGDGFGIVSTALMFAFINKNGMPFSKAEMYAVLRVLKTLRSAPFSSMENAVTITGILEQAGLIVDPLPLTDLLTDAQEAGFVDSE
jgi:hypothetical protein